MSQPSLHTKSPSKKHCDDKVLRCVKCNRYVLIPHNYVGGAWHLSGWADPTGTKHYGVHCCPCFDALHKLEN